MTDEGTHFVGDGCKPAHENPEARGDVAEECPICHGPCMGRAHPFDPNCYCGVCNGF